MDDYMAVSFAGVALKNPVVTASGTFLIKASLLHTLASIVEKAVAMSAGIAVLCHNG